MPQVSETTIILVEYPKRLAGLVRDSVGPLQKVRSPLESRPARHQTMLFNAGRVDRRAML